MAATSKIIKKYGLFPDIMDAAQPHHKHWCDMERRMVPYPVRKYANKNTSIYVCKKCIKSIKI